jgi:hypothetical protein
LPGLLEGLKVLILEDEFLIAMDVEQLCLDNGAAEVMVISDLAGVGADLQFDAAIVDVFLNGVSTFDFADSLKRAGKPFVFASGYTENAEVRNRFPGIALVGKPYSGSDLIEAVAAACGRIPASGSA